MGRKIVRKRRVFSIDPNKFATNYAKYLMKSLVKISSNNLSPQKFQKLVKFEVDMAMAQSATEFAWGNALKKKLLQRKIGNGNGFDFSLQTLKFSRENLEREEEEEEKMENGLKKLRKIIPGGGGGGGCGGGGFNGGLEEEELLKQTESYIKCLELQVNVLRCLVETNTI